MKVHLKTAWHHIRRSPYQTLTAVLTMTVSLFVASGFILSVVTLQFFLSGLEKKPQITAFFADTNTEENIRVLDERLKQTGKVDRTTYVSKEDALAIYKEQNKNDPLLLEMVTADILPASLEVFAKNPEDLDELANIIKAESGIEEVVYLQEEIETFVSWIKALRTEGLILVMSLAVVTLLVLLTVIGMKIALRSEEIHILQLLGATKGYIRWPFIIEGAMYGFLSGFLAWILSAIRYLFGTPFLNGYLFGGSLIPLPSMMYTVLPLFFILIIGGMLLGIIGSMLALLRYLK
jgi:cell division transport system permease protein